MLKIQKRYHSFHIITGTPLTGTNPVTGTKRHNRFNTSFFNLFMNFLELLWFWNIKKTTSWKLFRFLNSIKIFWTLFKNKTNFHYYFFYINNKNCWMYLVCVKNKPFSIWGGSQRCEWSFQMYFTEKTGIATIIYLVFSLAEIIKMSAAHYLIFKVRPNLILPVNWIKSSN